MIEFLFPLPDTPSPKRDWLHRHGLTTFKVENGRWRCMLNEETFGCGVTEEDACLDLCYKTRLKHWLVENGDVTV